jgi:hypothetical protein
MSGWRPLIKGYFAELVWVAQPGASRSEPRALAVYIRVTKLIVVATPIFDDHPGFLQRIENFTVEKFV